MGLRGSDLSFEQGNFVPRFHPICLGQMENSLGAKLLHPGLVEFGFPEELEGSHLHFHPLGLGALLDLHLLDFQFGVRKWRDFIGSRIDCANVGDLQGF